MQLESKGSLCVENRSGCSGAWRRWIFLVTALVIGGAGSAAQARPLNLGGALTVTYDRSTTFSDTDAGTTRTPITSLGQFYNIGAFGDFYRIGGYRADVAWMDQDVQFKNTDQKNRFNVIDYRLSLNLFPEWSPLSLTRQRIVRKTDVESIASSGTTRDRVDSFGANWVLNLRRVPRLVLSYQQSDLKTDQSGNFRTRAASATSDTTLGITRLFFGYQYSETDTQAGSTRSNGYNLDSNSQLTTSLMLTAHARYSSTSLPEVAPGVDFFEERSIGTSLVYRPLLHWWDGSASYSYSENPFFEDFRSHSLQGLANVRYNEKTDSGFSASLLHFSVVDSTVISESTSANLNYRPIFGLTTGLGGGAGLTSTETTGAADTNSLFQNYLYHINYSRPWQFLVYRASYQISYGLSDTQPTGFNSRDLTNNVSLGVDNADTGIVHVGFSSTYSDIQRVTESIKTDQSSYLIMLSADSSYPRDLILTGDALGLRSQVSYSDTTGFGVEGRVTSADLNAAYQTLIGLSLVTNYRIEDYPKELLLDRQIFTSQIQYSALLIMNLNLLISLRDVLEDNRYRPDINRLEQNASLNYRIGQLGMGVQVSRIETRSSGDTFGTFSILGRLTRSF